MNQEMVVDILQRAHIKVDVANNGAEAIAKAVKIAYDGILMDCHMPIMDGYEATRLWREQEIEKRIPIIALTANSSADNEVACVSSGMDAMLSKPFRKQQLEMLLSAWL